MAEILAPAGDKNSAIASINAGADAIYLGLASFSARSSAENFDIGSLKEICKYARTFGVKVYVALNTVVKDKEVKTFLDTAVEAWNSGASALILQDIFLGAIIKEHAPEIVLHLSTQAGTCNVYGAELAKKFGFDRVILARETSLNDIARISEIIETEAFVQGALCTCFSGQCYMSSFAGGNSGNRGKCKQPCRKKYTVDREGFTEKAYRLSLSDLCVGEDIKAYLDAGVTSFKIEGRMRRPEYASASVQYYKNILKGTEGDLSALKRTFNRGNYTKGLAFGQDKSFISSAVQGHIGEFAGVIKVENSKYVCLSNKKFSAGDGFKVLRNGKEVGGGAYGSAVKGGFTVITRDRLKNGDKVFVTTDTALNARLLSGRRTLPVSVTVKLFAGRPAEAEINGFCVTGDAPLESAQTRPLSREDVSKCFYKVDGYPFAPECDLLTDGVFMAQSALNAFRRQVYSAYFEHLTFDGRRKVSAEFALPEIFKGRNTLTAEIAPSLNGIKADIGILKPDDYSEDLTLLTDKFAGKKFLFVPPYLSGEELPMIEKVSACFDGIYCDSYFGIILAEKLGKPLFAGCGFNITNSASLAKCSAEYVCVSKELTFGEVSALSAENVFCLAGGNIKVMDLIYCPFEKKCKTCDMRRDYIFTDEAGRKFPLHRYKTLNCRFEVFNCADLISDKCPVGALIDSTMSDKNRPFTRGHTASGIL